MDIVPRPITSLEEARRLYDPQQTKTTKERNYLPYDELQRRLENNLCTKCGKNPQSKSMRWCLACRREYNKANYDPARQRKKQLRIKYGLDSFDYEVMLFKQGGVCAVCGQTETALDRSGKKVRPLAVDHNHETGEVRELLCHDCNLLLGKIEQDMERTKKLLKYIKKTQHLELH